ncbi:hypothetical protein POF63_02780 [Streptococcus agalactiae]|uniref:hypothetical protein n=1 Tax=Streptococcus agalactiae TaxID=1311 RepID=UPI0002BC70C7|nr:hypothetical protein [Streptococcus agalactiae]AIX04264.1 glycerophosphoryl diester phosphodiesterase family protein [Streptococcus agalactiae CNCTC 10/84]EPT56704.1 hypothetical protein SAG0053_06975 [Streptococcus agalactiae CCUG 25532]EPT85567.1 hypothetical protein SAG0099_03025 [Streptococcus agalactiae BSU247]EPV20885.1 hypothetical protein SAG0334_04605 [Streptococcus agalactiae GB00640]EPX02534.1 hypothetical protein SAG0147_08535 [Streptococcus agalactiae MRI Z1-048]
MEKYNYLFKLNVQPHILKKFHNKISELKLQVIPNAIYNAYNDLFSNPVIEKDKLSLVIFQDYREITDSEEYVKLIKNTEEIAIEYKKITIEYKKGNGIHYNPDFLEKLEKAMNDRKLLVSKFIVLSQANSRYTSSQAYEEIERLYDFNIDSEIGKGLDHLRRVMKIILYLEEQLQNGTEEIDVNYSFAEEIITINNVTIDEALASYKKIETKVNELKSDIGHIKINPIYENVVLNTTENMRTIEIITTYPNGNTDDELDILLELPRITGSKESRTTLISSDTTDNKDFLEKIYDISYMPSKKGYLSDIRSNGITIINFSSSTIKHE